MNRRFTELAALAFLGFASADATAQLDIFATTTTFEITGSTSRMDANSPFSTTNDLYTIHSDAVVRSHGRDLFVINRLLSDNVLVLDPTAGYSIVTQYTTGNGSNPQDIALLSPTKAYVTRYEESELWIVHPFTGTKLGEIDLAAFADGDGNPEMSQMTVVGTNVFVALQNLTGFVTTGESRVVVIDSTTDTILDVDPLSPGVVDAIELPRQNPSWEMEYHPLLQRILAVCSGNFLALDGGLVSINPFSKQVDGVLLDEAALGGDMLAAVVVGPTLGYALRGDTSFDTCLVSFDPSTGSVGSTLHCTTGFNLSDLEVADGKLYVGDRTGADPGVRIFDALTGAALVSSPVDVGLPPFDLEPIRTDEVTNSPIAPLPSVQLTVWPSPFLESTTLELRTELSKSKTPPKPIRIFDARGRLVRELTRATSTGAGWLFRWDGADETGRAVASGVYHARGAGASTRLVRTR